MCKGEEPTTTPAWRLEERAGAWRLAVAVAGAPEVELSEEALRLRPAGAAQSTPATTLPLPARALPVDTAAARCTFSRRRGELIVEWPRCTGQGIGAPAPRGAPREAVASAEKDGEEESECCAGAKEEELVRRGTAEVAPNGAAEAPVEEAPAPEAEADAEAPAPESVESAEAPAEPEAPAPESAALSAEEWKARGNEAVKAGDSEEAVRCYSAGLAVGGGDVALLHSNRALCLQKLKRHEEAVEDARRCVELKPDFFKGYLRGAMSLRALGRPEEALAFLKRCPHNDEAGALVAEIRPEAAAAEAERIAQLSGAERAKEEGNVLFRKGLFETALAKYSEALDLCKDQEGTLALALRNNRAACHHQLSDYSAVVADSSFVLAREPQNFKALMRRMLALEPLERYEAALDDARAVLRQDPRHEVANKMQHRLSKMVRELGRSGGA